MFFSGMKYLVVPHPDPDALKRKKESKDDHKLPIILKTNNEDMPSFEVEENLPNCCQQLTDLVSRKNSPNYYINICRFCSTKKIAFNINI